MSILAEKRCFNHSMREAAARCLNCGRFFCRECVTEHHGRVICSLCLTELSESEPSRRFSLKLPLQLVKSVVGIILTLLFFFSLAHVLLMIPDSFHEGTIWHDIEHIIEEENDRE